MVKNLFVALTMLNALFVVCAQDHMGAEGMRSWEGELEMADKGDADAIGTVAINYKDGHFGLRDYGKAIRYFEKLLSIEPDNAWAMKELGDIYMNNPFDDEKAAGYYRKAADMGHAGARIALAQYLYDAHNKVDEAKSLYRAVIKDYSANPGAYSNPDCYIEAILALYDIIRYDKASNKAEIDRLVSMVKEEAVAISPQYNNYLLRDMDMTGREPNGLRWIVDRVRYTAPGVMTLLQSRYIVSSFKDELVKEIETDVAQDKIEGGYSPREDETNKRDKAFHAAQYLVEKKQFKRALNLIKYAADRGQIEAAMHLAYYVYGKPEGELVGGPDPWPKIYKNAVKARRWKNIYDKFSYGGPSGW